MAVEFLTDEQTAGYGRFQGDPSQPELERFFFLDDADRDLISRRRGEHSRLGFAVQLETVRFLGTFLSPDPLDVPWAVVDYLARQLGVADSSVVKRYTDRAMTAYEHTWEIRRVYGYRDFADQDAQRALRTFAEARAWTRPEGPRALFDQAVAWLREQRILLPGASVLARLVTEIRAAAADRLYAMIASAAAEAGDGLPARLDALLTVPDGSRVSELERLRRAPARTIARSGACPALTNTRTLR